jgi:alpha-beta hydrolase superfamily lysophospholipase
MPRDFNENSSDAEFLRWIRTDPLQSKVISVRWVGALRRWIRALPTGKGACEATVLLIQGDADGTVDWRYNVKRVQRLVSSAQLVILAGAGHHLANESSPFRERMYAQMDEFFSADGVLHKSGKPLSGAGITS